MGPPSIPEPSRFPSVSPVRARNQIPVWQHTRHKLHPSDPTPAVINHPDLDRDHRQHHQPTSLPIQSHGSSTNGDLLSSPGSKRDSDGDGANREVSCLVTGLFTRCAAAGYIYAGVWVKQAWTILLCSILCISLTTKSYLPVAPQFIRGLNKPIASSVIRLLSKSF